MTDRFQERYCMGVAFSDGTTSYYMPLRHDSWMTPDAFNCPVVPDLLTGIDAVFVFHNAKFDLHVLKRAGFIIPDNKIYDTMLMSHLIFEDRFSHDLNSLAKDYLGVTKENELKDVLKGTKWEETPAFAMAKYAEQDANITLQLYHHLKAHFEPYEKVWDIDERFMKLLLDIEEKGIRIDKQGTREQASRCNERIAEINKELGFDPSKPSQLHKRLFTAPPDGLGLRITHRTPKGKPQVNTDFLESCNHPVAGLLLEYRRVTKELTGYYNSYTNLTGENYDRIHASFKQHGTVTGRLSCAEPNMQQIPRDSPVKKLFLPDEGKQLWEIDYRAIELRLAAVYSQEPVLLETFKVEGDVHQTTADLLGVDRHKAKTINFLIIYGGGQKALSKQLRIPEAECKKILDNYRNLYKNLFHMMRTCQEIAEESGKIRMWSGRERHFKWPSDANKAFNSVVQGGSFEIVKRSMLMLQDAGFDIRNQVHDSVWLMVDNEAQVKEAERIMSAWTEPEFGLLFSVESKRLN